MSYQKDFEAIKNSTDPEGINDFIIEIAQHPKKEYESFIDYFIAYLSDTLLNKVKLNLIFLIGEISSKIEIKPNFLNFLKDQYLQSDRWERNEIIKAFTNIAKSQQLKEKYIDVIGRAVKENYSSLKLNALKCLNNMDNIQDKHLKSIILALNESESEALKLAREILRRELSNWENLFALLDDNKLYKTINKVAIRNILLTFFHSIITTESFRKKVMKSNWEKAYKQVFLDEIDTYERILIKNP